MTIRSTLKSPHSTTCLPLVIKFLQNRAKHYPIFSEIHGVLNLPFTVHNNSQQKELAIRLSKLCLLCPIPQHPSHKLHSAVQFLSQSLFRVSRRVSKDSNNDITLIRQLVAFWFAFLGSTLHPTLNRQ